MSKRVPAGALPLLHISDLDVAQLRVLRTDLEQEILAEYEDYVFNTNSQVDTARWNHVRSDGHIHAYTEREGTLYRQESRYACSPASSSSLKYHRPQAAVAMHSAIPRVLAVGRMHGTLDDIMYGLVFHDTPTLRTQFLNQHDLIEDAAVLATIETATKDDPYRFLGIVWFLCVFNMPLSLIDNRDILTLNNLRMRRLSNGERVGISTAHSIQHRDLPELRDFATVRATSSLLRVYRQVDPKTVEVMMIHFLDTKGSTPDSFHAQESIKFLLPSSRGVVDGGFRRKLHWLARQQQEGRQSQDNPVTVARSGDGKHCEQCSKAINRLFSSSGCTCTLCNKEVCTKCSVKQDIILDMAASRPVTRPLDFCIECLVFAKAQSTLSIAQYELQHRAKAPSAFAINRKLSLRGGPIHPVDSLKNMKPTDPKRSLRSRMPPFV